MFNNYGKDFIVSHENKIHITLNILDESIPTRECITLMLIALIYACNN